MVRKPFPIGAEIMLYRRGWTDVKNDPVVAIAGVTGAVGGEFIATLNKRAFPVRKLKALASARSAGKTIEFRGETIRIEELR